MATPTYTALATTTLSSATASVTFGSIPSTYRDLIIVVQGTTTLNNEIPILSINGDTTSANYNRVVMYGDGTSTGSAASSTRSMASFGTSPAMWIGQLMDYSATDKHKTLLYRNDKSNEIVVAGAFRWANTAAVTSVTIEATSNTFTAGSTFSLFGIEA